MRTSLLILVILATASFAQGQTEKPVDEAFMVPQDETLPLDELSLLLTPLTREGLAQEVLLWQDLLQKKLRIISEVQISMKYLNRDIQVFENVKNSLDDFLSSSENLNQARTTAQEDTTQATADNLRNLEQTLIEKRFDLATTSDLAIQSEAKAIQTHNLRYILKAAKTSLDESGENTELGEFAHVKFELAQMKAELTAVETEFDPNNAELMTKVTTQVEEILRKKTGIRDLVMEYLSYLLDNREELVKRIRVVISEWEKKGATPEEIDPILTFIDDVTAFHVDVTDTANRWSMVQLWLKSDAGGIRVAMNIGKFLGMMLFFSFLAFIIGSITQKALHRTRNISVLMRDFIIRSTRRVVFLVGFMMSLSFLGVNIGPVLGVIGAAGFVLAFALQSTLGNFASGIMIMIYKPFDVGDAIDAAGVMGSVKTMNLTSTIINTFDNKLVIVPNNNIWGGVITNITGSQTRRVDLVFRIAYGDDTELAEKIIHEVLSEQEMILTEPEPNVQMHELSDFTVNFICRPWVRTTDYWDVRWELTKKIRARFEEAGFRAPVDPGAYIKRMGGSSAK